MDTLVQNTTWGLPSQCPQVPWALQNFPQMLEFTHLAPHRAPWDTRELAEQDIIKTEAFQNSPSELQKRKRKKKNKTLLQTHLTGYQESLKCLAEELKKNCICPELRRAFHSNLCISLPYIPLLPQKGLTQLNHKTSPRYSLTILTWYCFFLACFIYLQTEKKRFP